MNGKIQKVIKEDPASPLLNLLHRSRHMDIAQRDRHAGFSRCIHNVLGQLLAVVKTNSNCLLHCIFKITWCHSYDCRVNRIDSKGFIVVGFKNIRLIQAISIFVIVFDLSGDNHSGPAVGKLLDTVVNPVHIEPANR